MTLYRMKHRKPIVIPIEKAAKGSFNSPWENRVRSTYLNGHRVSTVFLSFPLFVDNQYGMAFFETMVFDSEGHSINCLRTKTHREALNAHWYTVALIKQGKTL